MRAALSVVLPTALVTTPIKLVLAQAVQQDSTNAETSLVQEPRSQRVIGVPAPTATPSLLWQPALENYSVQNEDEDQYEFPMVVRVVLGTILFIGLLVGIYFLLKHLFTKCDLATATCEPLCPECS